jgi:hypothetical protein
MIFHIVENIPNHRYCLSYRRRCSPASPSFQKHMSITNTERHLKTRYKKEHMAQSPIYVRARAIAMSATVGALQRKLFRGDFADVIFHMCSTISRPTARARQLLLVKENHECHATTTLSFIVAVQPPHTKLSACNHDHRDLVPAARQRKWRSRSPAGTLMIAHKVPLVHHNGSGVV